jgi:DNA-binding IclR family transcriptional regulator
LQSALSKVETGLQNLSFNLRPTRRELDVLKLLERYKELTSAQVAQNLDISRQQAFNLLNGLVEKGILVKEGETKNSYYHLK